MAWVLAQTAGETSLWKYQITAVYQGVCFTHSWVIHNYCPHADAFFPDSAGTFVYGTYFLRSWALPAPVSYRSVIAGANFFQRCNGSANQCCSQCCFWNSSSGAGLPDGAVDSGAIGDGSSPAPAPAPGFVRVCAKCGQLSYFRERCCLNPECESCLCL